MKSTRKLVTSLGLICGCLFLSGCTQKAKLSVIADQQVCWEVRFDTSSFDVEDLDVTYKIGCGNATLSIPPRDRSNGDTRDRYSARARITSGVGELAVTLVLGNEFTDSASTTSMETLNVHGYVDN